MIATFNIGYKKTSKNHAVAFPLLDLNFINLVLLAAVVHSPFKIQAPEI